MSAPVHNGRTTAGRPRPVACRDCGAIIAPGGEPTHVSWHAKLAALAGDLEAVTEAAENLTDAAEASEGADELLAGGLDFLAAAVRAHHAAMVSLAGRGWPEELAPVEEAGRHLEGFEELASRAVKAAEAATPADAEEARDG